MDLRYCTVYHGMVGIDGRGPAGCRGNSTCLNLGPHTGPPKPRPHNLAASMSPPSSPFRMSRPHSLLPLLRIACLTRPRPRCNTGPQSRPRPPPRSADKSRASGGVPVSPSQKSPISPERAAGKSPSVSRYPGLTKAWLWSRSLFNPIDSPQDSRLPWTTAPSSPVPLPQLLQLLA